MRDELNKLVNPADDVENGKNDSSGTETNQNAYGAEAKAESKDAAKAGEGITNSESSVGDPASLTPYKPSKTVFGTYRALLRNMQNQLLSFDRVFEWLVDGANARRALVMNFQVEDFGGSLRKMGRNFDNFTTNKSNCHAVQDLMRWKKSYQHAILEDGVDFFVGDERDGGKLSDCVGLFSPHQLVSLGLNHKV